MTIASVYLWGTKIGVVSFDSATGLGSFEYEEQFLTSGIEVAPLTMPLSTRIYSFPELSPISFHGLPGLLAESLPDKFGNAIINAWLQAQGRSVASFDPVERLCYTGNRGMGALEYVPALGPTASEDESIQVDRLVHFASAILQAREELQFSENGSAMKEIIRVGTSAGGARAKAVIAWNRETGDIRSGQIDAGSGYEYWLLKFDGVSQNGDKLHMQSLGGIAHYDFNIAGAYSYEQAVEVMRKLHLPKAEIYQFFLRMVFNVMARNQDDHVKNISFLMDRKGKWSLAPAYDVTYAYNPGGMWTGSHQMTIHGKRDNITKEDLLLAGETMGLRKSEMNLAIDKVADSLSHWHEFSCEAELDESIAEKIKETFILF